MAKFQKGVILESREIGTQHSYVGIATGLQGEDPAGKSKTQRKAHEEHSSIQL